MYFAYAWSGETVLHTRAESFMTLRLTCTVAVKGMTVIERCVQKKYKKEKISVHMGGGGENKQIRILGGYYIYMLGTMHFSRNLLR